MIIAIIKKQLKIKAELYTILQVLSLTLFEKIPLEQLLGNSHYMEHTRENAIQLNLFDNLTGHECANMLKLTPTKSNIL